MMYIASVTRSTISRSKVNGITRSTYFTPSKGTGVYS